MRIQLSWQSVCLTIRRSIVRIYQFPQSNFMDQRVLRSEDSLRRLAISMQVGICAQVRIRCILGIVPITQEIRAHKAWGSGTEYTAGNPYGLCRELGHEVCLIWGGSIAQFSKASDLHSEGQEFKSPNPLQQCKNLLYILT